MMAELDNY